MARPISLSDQDTDTAARQELDRVLASATFRQVDRLKRFLRFVALEALQGRGDQLKEYVIGVQVFDKSASFDPRADPIVRVQARRLRTRLARYYREEGADDTVVVDLPKGGYAPIFRIREAASGRRSLGATLAGQNTITVLPFADLSPARDLDYFCEGLRQETIHRLARLDALRVLTTAAGEAGPAAPGDGYPTPAALQVTGSVRKAGDRLRTTVHLVDSATASYLWSESIDADADEVFAAQDAVADAVVRKLEPRLLDAGQRRGSRRAAENLAARNLYVQGRYHLSQRTDEGLHKALEFFEKAIVEDPQFAPAHSGLADAHGLMAHYGVRQPAVAWARAASSAASAVMLDGNSAEAHT